jgi:hypothetical protein
MNITEFNKLLKRKRHVNLLQTAIFKTLLHTRVLTSTSKKYRYVKTCTDHCNKIEPILSFCMERKKTTRSRSINNRRCLFNDFQTLNKIGSVVLRRTVGTKLIFFYITQQPTVNCSLLECKYSCIFTDKINTTIKLYLDYWSVYDTYVI